MQVETLPANLIIDHTTPRELFRACAAVLGQGGPPPGLEAEAVGTRRAIASVVAAGMSAVLPSSATSVRGVQLMAACGVDTVSQVPAERWIADTRSVEVIATKARHGGFVRGGALFDNAAFSVSPAEAAAMDPQQRLLLEHGYRALHGARLERGALMGTVSGVFLGIAANDWADVLKASKRLGASVYAATGSSHSVASGRVSYVLGMQGPCASYDTACSAALVACHAALRALQRLECTSGIASGVALMLLPNVAQTFATAGMTSTRGRCHTFDHRADGYARGEACCGLALRESVSSERMLAAMCGSCVRQDGRSASLTAPNGQAQQALLRAALADGAVPAEALTCAEAHGTGTGLGDPIETGSLAGAVLSQRRAVGALPVGSVKANAGHAEPAAGVSGLLKLLQGLLGAEAAGNAQLRAVNDHVCSALHGVVCALPTQHALAAPCRELGAEAATGGVSSFGYSGTIAHALLETSVRRSSRSPLLSSCGGLLYRQHCYLWRASCHPLMQCLSEREGSRSVFRSPAAGALLALVADHVVQGRVVFPGAAYLEMARASCRSATEAGALASLGASLERVFFLQPLLIGGGEGSLWLDCEVDVDAERFEISSEQEASGRTAHCAGASSASTTGQLPLVAEQPVVRRRCPAAVEAGWLYAMLASVGLEYGPVFRTLSRAWAARATGGAVGYLRRRSFRHGTMVHPADLDGAMQLSAVLAEAGSNETRLPFSVGVAVLRDMVGSLWPVRHPRPRELRVGHGSRC